MSAGRRLWVMLSREDRVQVVLSIQPLVGEEDRRLVTEALTQLEGVHAAHVDVGRGVVRIDGAASDVELLATLEALGKRAAIVTHVRVILSGIPLLFLFSLRAVPLSLSLSCAHCVQTRAVKPATSSSSSGLAVKLRLFAKLIGRQANCCS